MSGGHFGYKQSQMRDVGNELQRIAAIAKDGKDEYYNFSKEVVDKLIDAAYTCRRAAIMTERVDWLVSGDDGEEPFLERLKDELNKLDSQYGR